MKVAIYARTSRQEGDDEGSIPVQIADCREWAEEQGHEVVAEYQDPGITGWKRKVRPDYERLYADAEAGRIDAVLCRDYERLLRNDKEGARWLELFETRGFRHFLFADEADIDLGRARDRKDFKERVAGAVFYSDRLSEKIRRTKARNATAGTYTGGEREPYGYRRVAGKLVVDPEEAAALHDAVTRLARGETATRITREWNAAGAHTSKGSRWRPPTLRRTLLSGHLVGKRGYPRVLSEEEAAVVTVALASEPREPGRPTGLTAPLAGFLRCAECKSTLSTGDGAYRCTPSHGGCGAVSIKQLPLERWMLLESLRRWLEVQTEPGARREPAADTGPLLEELRRLEDREAEITEAVADPDSGFTVQAAGDATRRIGERRKQLTDELGHTLKAPATEPPVRSLVEVFTPDELADVGLGWMVRTRTVNAALPFRARWEARDPEAVAQVRDLYGEVLSYAVISRRVQRGRGFDPSRVRVAMVGAPAGPT